MLNKKFDVIIIGAGLGGLSAGCLLSKNGKKVLLLEQHDKVGGFATNFKRKGFTFDVSLHNLFLPSDNKILKNILSELNILDKIRFKPFKEFQRIIFPEHDIVIPKGINNYSQLLKIHFPSEADGIDAFFNTMNSVNEEFEDINTRYESMNDIQDDYPMLPVKYPNLVKLVEKSLGELIDNVIKDEKLKGILSQLWWLNGLPPGEQASLASSLTIFNYYQYSGGLIDGTSQELSDSFKEEIELNNGEIHVKTKVVKINMNFGRVSGVLTENGEIFKAPVIISNSNAPETFTQMIDEDFLNKKFIKKIKNYKVSVSALQLYIGLDCDPRELGMNNHSLCIYNSYDHEENFENIIRGDYEDYFFCITNYSPFYNELKEQGKGIIHILTLDHIRNWEGYSKDDYKKRKKEVAGLFINRAEKYIPGLSKHIEVSELGTPVTIKRYTGHPEGAIYGFSQNLFQSGINRLSSFTPIEGLYLAGAYCYPGGGYFSVIFSGYNTAKLILKEKL